MSGGDHSRRSRVSQMTTAQPSNASTEPPMAATMFRRRVRLSFSMVWLQKPGGSCFRILRTAYRRLFGPVIRDFLEDFSILMFEHELRVGNGNNSPFPFGQEFFIEHNLHA